MQLPLNRYVKYIVALPYCRLCVQYIGNRDYVLHTRGSSASGNVCNGVIGYK